MLLHVLNEHARRNRLVESIELTDRTIHLVLKLRSDGTVEPGSPWLPLNSVVSVGKKEKTVPGVVRVMPRFPGENNGGKAHFLADGCGPVLGIDPKTGAALPDDPKVGKNATKAFLHFWRRIEEAHATTRSRELATLLAFRDRYLANQGLHTEFVGQANVGKTARPAFLALTDSGPIPLEGMTIAFSVDGSPVFERDGPLHAYWSTAYRREAFSEQGSTEGLGLCMITGLDSQPIAQSHKPEIKGIPGLPPKGGYLVSFAREAPAFASYGFEGGRNAPVSEQAVAGYALALNALLRDPRTARRFSGGFVLVSWLREHPELAEEFQSLLDEPTPEEVREYLGSYEKGQPRYPLRDDRYYSLTLASNGGRVVVRRWLDVGLGEVVDHLKQWFADLEIEVIESPRLAAGGKRSREGAPAPADRAQGPNYRALAALARITVRTAEDIRPDVYDALSRAALEGTSPTGLLGPVLHRLRVAAVESGGNVRYHTSRFALLRLILNRSSPGDENAMTIDARLCETADPAYNSGRLLAALDDLQSAAQGNVGADVLAHYGRASTVPRNVFPSLLQLAQSHLKKLGNEKPGLATLLDQKIAGILALFIAPGPDGCPDFPGLMNVQQQGRFALGFYQQKAADHRERLARKATVTPTDSPPTQRD